MTLSCTECGETIGKDDKFCGGCGASIPAQLPRTQTSQTSKPTASPSDQSRNLGIAALITVGAVLLAVGGYQAMRENSSGPATPEMRTAPPANPQEASRPQGSVLVTVGDLTPGGCIQLCEDAGFCTQVADMNMQTGECKLELDTGNSAFTALANSCPQVRSGRVAATNDGSKWFIGCPN